MGEEHDSWVEGIGVGWFKSSDATASVASGAGKAASGVWDALKSGAKAVGDVAEAEWDAAAGAGATVVTGAIGIAAGAAYAVGDDSDAKALRATQESVADDAVRHFRDAGKELGEAKDEVFGVPPILPPPPPPGTPPMPPIPPNPPPPDDLEPPTDRDPPSDASDQSGTEE